MMRLTCATLVAILISALDPMQSNELFAQQTAPVPSYARPSAQPAGASAQSAGASANGTQSAGDPVARVASQNQAAAPSAPAGQPFPALSPAAQAQLQELLTNWEAQSKGTKTLECTFSRWHYDMFAAPPGVHATRADGEIKYASPDKGLFRVDRLVFFNGIGPDGTPQYQPQPNQYGEHWVCNGTQLIEFDRSKEECRIQDLPPEMQGQQIFNSPLPFVFNLDANQIQQRYWVRQVEAPKPGIVVVEAWPKRQEDRAQYKLVQIALSAETFLPQALLMYAPNYDKKTAPKWDHYEFSNVKRNAIGASFQKLFLGNFIPEKPPAHWKILRDKFIPPVDAPIQRAAAPAGESASKR